MTFLACENMSVKNGKDLWFSWGSNESLGRVHFFFRQLRRRRNERKNWPRPKKVPEKWEIFWNFLLYLKIFTIVSARFFRISLFEDV